MRSNKPEAHLMIHWSTSRNGIEVSLSVTGGIQPSNHSSFSIAFQPSTHLPVRLSTSNHKSLYLPIYSPLFINLPNHPSITSPLLLSFYRISLFSLRVSGMVGNSPTFNVHFLVNVPSPITQCSGSLSILEMLTRRKRSRLLFHPLGE